MELGLMAVNQRLDFDTISLICEEFGYAAHVRTPSSWKNRRR